MTLDASEDKLTYRGVGPLIGALCGVIGALVLSDKNVLLHVVGGAAGGAAVGGLVSWLINGDRD